MASKRKIFTFIVIVKIVVIFVLTGMYISGELSRSNDRERTERS